MKNLSELLGIHGELEKLFFEHQRHLIRFEFDAALTSLERYQLAIVKHIGDEDEHLLPIYAERGEQLKGGAVRMFYDEHEKIKAHLELFINEVRNLPDEAEPEARLIWLLEREGFYKKLCDHHDIRETRFLYPELDRITSDSEKAKLLGRVTNSFARH
jgi:hypothetical protein